MGEKRSELNAAPMGTIDDDRKTPRRLPAMMMKRRRKRDLYSFCDHLPLVSGHQLKPSCFYSGPSAACERLLT